MLGILFGVVSVCLIIILLRRNELLKKRYLAAIFSLENHLIESVTTLKRGTDSERRIILDIIKSGISPKRIFHDLYIPKEGEKYSQTDLVVISPVGVIVLEIKDYSGWIFGNGFHEHWTQVLAYGNEKYRFYNPVKQNEGHISSIRTLLYKLDSIPFFSVVVFDGNCELKVIENIPRKNYVIYRHQLADTLNQIIRNNPTVTYPDVWEMIRSLQWAVNNGNNTEIVEAHIGNINRKYY